MRSCLATIVLDFAFAEAAMEELGLSSHAPHSASNYYRWDYPTLDYHTPPSNPANKVATATIYRGIVPAKNILRRNFALNGAIVSNSVHYLRMLEGLKAGKYLVYYERRILL